MKKASKRPSPSIARGIVPTAIASGLLSPVTMGAPGDLDPSFADMGRLSSALQFNGPAWSVQPLAGDESLFAGGQYCDYYCAYYSSDGTGYIGHVSGSGALQSQFADVPLGKTEVRDVALQSDGKIVAVGRLNFAGVGQLTVLRFQPDGTLDSTFANSGVLSQPFTTGAQAVTMDPSGAIAVAGSANGKLIVIRLLANGTLDPSFGDAGIFHGPTNSFLSTDILRTTSGGYRISTNSAGECHVVGVTADGKLDNSFGTAGIAAPAMAPPGEYGGCASMVAQSDGRLLVAGGQGDHGFAVRLLASGAPDASFAASQVPAAMVTATALAVDATGNIVVAGRAPGGVPGALVVRLQSSGALDPLFGSAGSAWIDLDSTATPGVNDLKVLADGRVLAAGGSRGRYGHPFVVRLLGDAGTPGAGVIGVTPSIVTAKEKDQAATVTVRRTGGAAGAVSVAYHTGNYTSSDVPMATAGQDYTAVSGQLSWADGDRTDKQITVPVAVDAGPAELSERFVVTLDGATGGAAFGTNTGVVEILGDGDPGGQFDMEGTEQTVSEADGMVTVYVDRNYYSSGATSVTLTPIAGTATSADFVSGPVTLSWGDGDASQKSATFVVTQDSVSEGSESFTVELSNPTNGAVIGPYAVQTVTITDSTPPPPPPPPASGGGGGGGLDWLTLACLSVMGWLRRRPG